MQTVLVIIVLVVALVILAIQYGVAKAQRKAAERQARLGAEIEKIIARNANIEQHDWLSWLQEHRDK